MKNSIDRFKNIFLFVLLMMLITVASCKAQPKADYEIYSNNVATATQYHFFLEKKSANPYRLNQGMDYLSPDVTALQVGVSTDPLLTVNLTNDGSEYAVGIVAVNSSGYYSGMGVAIGTAGIVPQTPGGVGFRKK